MVDYLARDGIQISRDRVRILMRSVGLWAIDQKPRTTVQGDPLESFPCLVDLRLVKAVDQVWATDITYLPLQKGFLFLVAIVILFSRNVYSSEKPSATAGSSPAAWTRSNVSLLRRWRWEAAAGQRSFTPTRAVGSPALISWPDCRPRRSMSAGQAGSAAMTTSWWRGCGAESNTRGCTCMPTEMAGLQKSA